VEADHLLRWRPFVYHYTTAAGAERIAKVGAWTALDLLAAYGVDKATVQRLVTFPRSQPYELDDPVLGHGRLSHQRPMLTPSGRPHPLLLASLKLTGTPLAEFCRLLADRVFFFPTAYDPGRRSRPAAGFVERVSHDGPLCEVAFDTAALLGICGDASRPVELSAHNAGSPPRSPIPKGRITWRPVAEFDQPVQRIQEVVVVGSLPPLREAIGSVRDIFGGC
jgi:hypothetical protein